MKSLIIAPHSDDALLSLGGRILMGYESFEVLNIFSTCACSVIPELKNPAEITRRNNAEERRALGCLAIPVEFLGLNEVMLRGYKKWTGQVDTKKDSGIIEEIAKRVAKERTRKRFYLPLGIGQHTDHLLVADIGIQMLIEGFFKNRNLFFYEDLPYAIDGGIEERISYVEKKLKKNLEVESLHISSCIDTKLDLICLYETQYDREYVQKIKGYSRKVGNGKFVERIWKISGS